MGGDSHNLQGTSPYTKYLDGGQAQTDRLPTTVPGAKKRKKRKPPVSRSKGDGTRKQTRRRKGQSAQDEQNEIMRLLAALVTAYAQDQQTPFDPLQEIAPDATIPEPANTSPVPPVGGTGVSGRGTFRF